MISTANRATILLVEDEPDVLRALTELLGEFGYDVVAANSAEQALDVLNVVAPDLIITDVHMGAMSGIDLCARVKHDPRYEFTPVVILTAVSELESRVAGLAAGADDFFHKPVEFAELSARVATLLRVKFLVDQLERTEAVIATLALTIEARDPYIRGHSDRLARYAVAVGQALGVDARTLRALQVGGYLHDLGKIALPDRILLKPGLLDARERKLMQAHPIVGSDLVQGLRGLELVRPIIRHHHERWDGSGYPTASKARRFRSAPGSSHASTSTMPCTPRAPTDLPCHMPRRFPCCCRRAMQATGTPRSWAPSSTSSATSSTRPSAERSPRITVTCKYEILPRLSSDERGRRLRPLSVWEPLLKKYFAAPP